jgi:hypothetical protein
MLKRAHLTMLSTSHLTSCFAANNPKAYFSQD